MKIIKQPFKPATVDLCSQYLFIDGLIAIKNPHITTYVRTQISQHLQQIENLLSLDNLMAQITIEIL